MSKNHTAKDFENADFARCADGRRAHRMAKSWAFEAKAGGVDYAGDCYMVERGWVPVSTRPTVTKSQLWGAANDRGLIGIGIDDQLMNWVRDLGVEVTPEPSNAEKLEQVIMDADVDSLGGYETLAEYLDKAGVKAPDA